MAGSLDLASVGWDSENQPTHRAGEGAVCRTGSVAIISKITENADMINKASVVPYSSRHLRSSCNLSNM